jgi:hypothetical protein
MRAAPPVAHHRNGGGEIAAHDDVEIGPDAMRREYFLSQLLPVAGIFIGVSHRQDGDRR